VSRAEAELARLDASVAELSLRVRLLVSALDGSEAERARIASFEFAVLPVVKPDRCLPPELRSEITNE
jgi:hypothetical protein